MNGMSGRGFDHGRAQAEVERAHGRAEANWRAPFWLVAVGATLAVGVLVALVLYATLGS